RALYSLVHKCLSRRRSDRYASAAALADAIDKVLDTHDLPVLELSQVLGEAVQLPSEHMKTKEFSAGTTLPFGVTTPTRQVIDRSTTAQESTRPVLESTRPGPLALAAREQRDDEPQIVEAIVPQTSTVRRRSPLPLAFVALLFVLGLGVFALRGRTASEPAAAAPSPSAKEVPSSVAPPVASPSASASVVPAAATAIETTPIKATKKTVATPAKSSHKSPHGAANEGLVHPGF
ncbi:MAG: hypothetical protein ACXVCJ_27610, partial [Polyangiales bacterium]